LKRLGIHPDQPDEAARVRTSQPVDRTANQAPTNGSQRPAASSSNGANTSNRRNGTSDGAPDGAQFTMLSLKNLIEGHPGVGIDDRRGASGGRLWVEDPKQRIGLGNELKRLGFKWANSRQAWYYPEN
jgi:hypothetical protein